MPSDPQRIVVVGGGFTGLSAAYDLARAGHQVTVLESDTALGGLAGAFETPYGSLERFYHHWFSSDQDVMALAKEIGLEDRIIAHEGRTGLYYANSTFRLASPLDLLRFKPLPLLDRIRLGLLVLRARRVKDWRALESISARAWLSQLAGRRAFEVVWEPLLRGKFGRNADDVSAVWFWNKLKLRGSSRGKKGREELYYVRGGFSVLIDRLAERVRELGGEIRTGCRARRVTTQHGAITGVATDAGTLPADQVLLTVAPRVALDLCPDFPPEYGRQLAAIQYLGNVCLVLVLSRSLSDTYWLNVNDPSFPFVGIIEHTNFEPPSAYGGRHIVYLSKYLPTDEPMFGLSDAELLRFALPHIRRMFPDFREDWIVDHFVWRAEYAQPLVVQHYSQLIPAFRSPIDGLWLCNMAQIYPEDRGTNYAVQYGRRIAKQMIEAPRAARPAKELARAGV